MKKIFLYCFVFLITFYSCNTLTDKKDYMQQWPQFRGPFASGIVEFTDLQDDRIFLTTPLFAHGLIYIHNAHGRYSPILAIKPDAKGDITLHKDSTTNESIVWSIKRGGAYSPTNVIYGDYMYNMRMNGQLTCYNALTGELIYRERLPGNNAITASGIASNGRLYYSTEQGDIFILKTGNDFEVIAKNTMNDIIMATPAISENTLYWRTQHYLVAVGK